MGSVRSDSKEERDFLFADNLEPHATRRKEILKAHPEITKLMGPEWRTKYLVAATVALQITLACFAKSWSFWTFVAVAYIVGATANHSLFLAIHELAHNLGAKSASANKIIGMVANLPIVFPYCITFKPYHMAHHRNQGVEGIDTDVPTLFEGYLITKSSFGRVDHMIRKAIFMFFQIFAYALRPMFIKPDLVPLDFWVLCNFFVMAFFDYFMFVTVGWQAVVYFLLSTFFAGSIHPTAGHFIAEHYVMEGDAETYSYYGPLNRLAYNVGYHNADVPLTDFLLQRWPSFFSTSSVARRTVARGRVWMAEEVVQSGAPGAELGPLRQAWWSESIKGKTILFVPDYPRRSPHETKLVVLWEDDHLAVVVKEPGLRLFGGIRTLANMLAAKEEGASLHPSKEEDALPAPVPLHFLEAEIGGCVLVAKTARAALQGLSSPSRCFQGLFVTGGVLWDEAKLLAATGWTLRRMEPSVRFGHLLAAERGAAEHSAAALRCSAAELAAANGAPALLGDVEFGGEEAPRIRRNQLFLVVSRRELQRNFGIEDNADGTYIFGGGEGGPELFRLHQACVLFEELCQVSSPLRDTLRFLQREMLNCIFANYKAGADLLQLTPFFVLRTHEKTHMEECEQRRAEADLEIEASHRRLEEAKKQVQNLKQQLHKDRQNAQKENESYEVVISQRNELRQKIEGLRESNNLRFEELRETNAELSSLQASSYLTRKDLDQARKDMATMNVQLKESNTKVLILSKRVNDLQDALGLMSSEGSRISSKVVSRNAPQGANLELPNELEMELNVITSRVSSKKKKKAEDSAHFGHERSTVDGRRLLRALMPQGGYQVVLKATVEDQMGLQPASTPAVAAAAAAASRRGGKEGIPPVLIVSGEAFAALAISQGLPFPPDPLQYGAHDDEDLVKEVGHDVQLLSEEYGMLLELYRGLRQDLKRTLRLVPDFNTDELRGALQNVMILDSEERSLVPPPVLETEFIGLGEGPDVPPYLRFVGSISTKLLSTDLVHNMCEELWLSKTQHVLQEDFVGRPQMPLDVFINEKFLPARAGGRPQQMELIYNFLVALRQSTTLKDNNTPDGERMHAPTENAKRGSRVAPARRRRSSVRRMSGEGQAIELPEVCPSCGNIFAPDAIFCRMCRTKRPGSGEKEKSESQICSCGNVFMPDAVFCRRCGSERPKDQGHSSDKRNKGQDLLLLSFNPFSETLYRGLLRDMHEDTFHDATTMLLNLCSCLHALQHRFRSSASRLIEDDESSALQEMNVSVLSAVLRLFFPRKPREHLTALKSMLHSKAQLNAVRTRDKLKNRASAVQFQEVGKDEPSLPPSIAIKEIFGLPPMDEHGRMIGGHRALLENLLRSPTPFILELRRQHLLECILAADKLQRALRVNRKSSGQAQGSAADEPAQMAAKEILEALGKADRDLTADQRHVYLLRGFGRRLPDMPSTTEMDLGNEALKAAVRANKVRRMLQDYAQEVVQSGAHVVVDDFLRNLQSSGVVKSGKSWEAALSLQDVAKESGISAMVVISPGKAIMDELMAAHIASGTAQEEGTHRPVSHEGRTFSKHANKSFPPPPPMDSEPFEKYSFFSELGQDVQELSLGYSASYLSFWINNSL